jgi:hypothetical protein
MNEETRRHLAEEVQFKIVNGLPFEDRVVAVSPTDYTVRGVPEIQFDLVDDAIEAYTDGDSFDTFVQKLVSGKKVDDLTTFLDWLVAQYGSALSQEPGDEAVIAKWLVKVEQVNTLLRDPSS